LTAIDEQPAPAGPERSGFNVPIWVGVVVGGLVLAGVAFVIGLAIGDRHDGRERFRGFGERVDGNGGRHWVAIVFLLIVIALVIAAVVLLVRHFGSTTRASRNAEDLLADRFARGEIDEAEYRSRRDALRG
jgi:putative membrane protein